MEAAGANAFRFRPKVVARHHMAYQGLELDAGKNTTRAC